MGCQEDVIKIGKKLEKMISSGTQDHGTAMDLLNTLKKLPITLDILQKSRIGITVNNFRKSSKSEEVISQAKALIKSWKKLLPADNGSQSSSSQKSTSKESPPAKDDTPPAKESSPESKKSVEPRQTCFPSRAEETNDSVRLKCREMLANALRTGVTPDNSGDPEEIAAAIEQCIFKEFGNTDTKYKNRLRSRVANLKDQRNPELRENVLLGQIAASKLAVMNADEMASNAMKDLRAKYTKQSIDDHQMAVTAGTKTDLLKCGKCLKSNCTYNQVQTRSADEPMTTFVFCNECGNRWKFC